MAPAARPHVESSCRFESGKVFTNLKVLKLIKTIVESKPNVGFQRFIPQNKRSNLAHVFFTMSILENFDIKCGFVTFQFGRIFAPDAVPGL